MYIIIVPTVPNTTIITLSPLHHHYHCCVLCPTIAECMSEMVRRCIIKLMYSLSTNDVYICVYVEIIEGDGIDSDGVVVIE